MFYNDTQSFPIFLKILIRLKVGVFDRAVKLDPPIEVFCKNSKKFEIFCRCVGNMGKFNVGIPDCQIQICETKSQMKQISKLLRFIFTCFHKFPFNLLQLQKKNESKKR
jgi:hypothetical protein